MSPLFFSPTLGQVHLPSDDLPLLLHAALGDEAHHAASLLDRGESLHALDT